MNSRPLPRRRGGTLRKLAWLSAVAMLAVSAFAPATTYAGVANNVNSITVPDCIDGGMSGTLDVTVGDAPFVFDIWVTDHKPSEGFWVEIPGSRVQLSISSSDSAYPFGPLDVSQHRDGVNSYRVETDGSNAKSASIHPCGDATPTPTPTLPPTPTPVVTPTPTPAPVGAIEILKIDNKGTATFDDDELLDGASFAIYLDDGDSIFELAQDTLAGGPAEAIDGHLTFDNLVGGSYWIVETVVPAGFVGSDPILIDLNLDASLVCLWDSTGSLGCEDGEGPSDVVFVDNAPEGAPTPTGSELPAESERPTPSGQVGGVIGTPGVTPPTTDALTDATSSMSGSWRIVLAGLAGLIVLALVFTQPSRARRER